MALCLTLKEGEKVQVGPNVFVEVGKIYGDKRATIRFTAPREVKIVRQKAHGFADPDEPGPADQD